ncbi:VOC family protein [Bacillus sp. BGMRC 2118]|nr:VOC family protein [Bacillus sp. BGMRC 2118]
MIGRQVGAIFIPVSNIEKARDWYCDILHIEEKEEIQFEHIYVIPLQGINIVLDSKIYSEQNLIKTPLFHFNSTDIKESYRYLQNKAVAIVTDIQFEHYFHFQDPDGNLLMVCKC